jgi:LPXTG-motif cell wall-anchored protein
MATPENQIGKPPGNKPPRQILTKMGVALIALVGAGLLAIGGESVKDGAGNYSFLAIIGVLMLGFAGWVVAKKKL